MSNNPHEYNQPEFPMTLMHRPAANTPGPSPSDIAYDDMTRAWRNGDYPLAWSLADALLRYLANGGQPLTGGRDVYYSRRVHAYYLAPGDPLVMPAPAIRDSDRPELPGEQHAGDSDPPEPEEEE